MRVPALFSAEARIVKRRDPDLPAVCLRLPKLHSACIRCAVLFFAVSTRSLEKPRIPARAGSPLLPLAVVQPRLAAEAPPLLPRTRVGSRRALPAQQVAMPISLRSGRSGTRPPTSYRDANISPTLSATTSASKLDLGEEGPKIIVTRADVRRQSSAYVPAEWETDLRRVLLRSPLAAPRIRRRVRTAARDCKRVPERPHNSLLGVDGTRRRARRMRTSQGCRR